MRDMEKKRAYDRAYSKIHRDRIRPSKQRSQLLRRYGLSSDEYDQMLDDPDLLRAAAEYIEAFR